MQGVVEENVANSFFPEKPKKLADLVKFFAERPTRERLLRLQRSWQLRAELRGEDPEQFTLQLVCERIFVNALDGAEAELGPLPALGASDAEWAKYKTAVQKALASIH